MKNNYILFVFLFFTTLNTLPAASGYFADCAAFITVNGTFYEVGACSGASAPLFDGTDLGVVSSFTIDYAEQQTFENGGDDVNQGFLEYEVWTGASSSSFTPVELTTLDAPGNGNEKRSVSPGIDLFAGLAPNTTYTLEIFYRAPFTFTGGGGGSSTHFHSNGGGNYRLTFTTDNSLPVVLTKFEASTKNNEINLNWQTASELNNSHFDIQRSNNSKTWNTLDKVAGAGTTDEVQDYTFTDNNPIAGLNYYRLVQVDYDGAFEYSPIVSVDMGKVEEVSVFPNPVIDQVVFDFDTQQKEGTVLSIYHLNGQLVQTHILKEDTSKVELNMTDLVKGVYFMQVIQNNTQMMTRFVKQ